MERVGDREGQMERYCSTGQSTQRAVAPTEEEEEYPRYSNIQLEIKQRSGILPTEVEKIQECFLPILESK